MLLQREPFSHHVLYYQQLSIACNQVSLCANNYFGVITNSVQRLQIVVVPADKNCCYNNYDVNASNTNVLICMESMGRWSLAVR